MIVLTVRDIHGYYKNQNMKNVACRQPKKSIRFLLLEKDIQSNTSHSRKRRTDICRGVQKNFELRKGDEDLFFAQERKESFGRLGKTLISPIKNGMAHRWPCNGKEGKIECLRFGQHRRTERNA